MHNEFTAVFERDGDWHAYSPEIPGANGQGHTKEEAREDGLRAVSPDVEREAVRSIQNV